MDLTTEIDNLLTDNDLQSYFSHKSFARLLSPKRSSTEILSVLSLIQKRGVQAIELAELAQTIRSYNHLNLKLSSSSEICDACGTGGDQAGTFNISTISSIIAASAGAKIAKHGNYSITSQCGSSNLIEAFGINLNASERALKECFDIANMLYLHAPRFSSAFSFLKLIRKQLSDQKIKTIFNLLGPLVNPLNVQRQIIGVYDEELVSIVAQALSILNTQHSLVFYSTDFAMDELIPNSKMNILEIRGKSISEFKINWNILKLRRPSLALLKGGDVAQNKRMSLNLLQNIDRTARRDTVALNAAAILYIAGISDTIDQGVQIAIRQIESGRAIKTLAQLQKISHGS